jgi:hypothetical protein
VAIPAICDRLDLARPFDTMPLVGTLLAAAFPRRREAATELTALQRQVLARMVNTEELWSIGNLLWTFQEYGLPCDREKCASLVGVRVAANYTLDVPTLERLAPDLIVTQALCDVCAVAEAEVTAACSLPTRPTVVNLEPMSLGDVLESSCWSGPPRRSRAATGRRSWCDWPAARRCSAPRAGRPGRWSGTRLSVPAPTSWSSPAAGST